MYTRLGNFYCQPVPNEEGVGRPENVGDLMHSMDYSEEEFKMTCRHLDKDGNCRARIEHGIKGERAGCVMIKEHHFFVVPSSTNG